MTLQAAPHKKLPPLYVLDSIAKNVGTPYTLFFSRKLYQTYMDAYAMVDMPTRRKLEEMLKTWKEPVPGSIDTRPVFPPDVVRPIENALIKVRTTTLQQDQERMRNQQQVYGRGRPVQGAPYRETPTPPGARPPSQVQAYPPQQPPMQHSNGIPYSQATQPPPISYQSQPVSSLFDARSRST
jgi:pre-mRNA cleavage complex 2 protein Pcf11